MQEQSIIICPDAETIISVCKEYSLPTQSGPKVPFREAEIQAKQFVKDVITATQMLMEEMYQALEEVYNQPMSRTVVTAVPLSKQLAQKKFKERKRLIQKK